MGIGDLHVCTQSGCIYIRLRPLSLFLSPSLPTSSIYQQSFLGKSQEREASEVLHYGHGIAYGGFGGAQS